MLDMTLEELNNRVSKASSVFKTMTGIGNNSAWAACMEALDHIRQHPRYKHRVKQAYKTVLAEFSSYERNLLFARYNRLFCIKDMTEDTRKRYGNISDREYYDYWAAGGATIYANKRKWFTNLCNKYRLYLIAHNIEHPDIVAWALAAGMALKLAMDIYEQCVIEMSNELKINKIIFEKAFGRLYIASISKEWDDATLLLEPRIQDPQYSELEQKNIQHGINQLQDEWTSMRNVSKAISDTTEAFDEIFRTKGEQKKALKKLAELT
jgi:hypothetical protein